MRGACLVGGRIADLSPIIHDRVQGIGAEATMKIIDAQVHIVADEDVPTSGLHRKVRVFSAEELLTEMDEAGVDAALIHPPLG